MARVSGKCPACNEVIRVNDEREIGHCAKCGAEINVSESILLFQANSTVETASYQTQAPASQRSLRREQREREIEKQANSENAKQRIHDMFQQCSNEQEFLGLRSKIMSMDIPDAEKSRLLEALDIATKDRLEDTFKKAKDYAENQESPLALFIACIIIAGIGLAVNHYFSMKWPGIIAVGFAIIGFIGSMSEKLNQKKMAEGKAATELIDAYRRLGYKI